MSLFNSLSTSISGLSAQSYALNNISGNIANASTPGFKATETAFSDLLPDITARSASGSVGARSRLTTEFQGTIANTDTSTNIAISGDGYFVVKQNTGTATAPSFTGESLYTRRGDFAQGSNGYLVNAAGYYLVGGTTPTGAPAPIANVNAAGSSLTDISVSSSGRLTGGYADGSSGSVGQVTLAQFPDENGLQSLDGGAYLATDQSGSPAFGLNGASLTGGALEQSDASISDQFAKMIVTQQAYSANTKTLTTENEMLSDAISMYV